MTAKEKVLAEAPNWTEEQALRALRAVHSPGEEDSEHTVDEWGDLDALTDAAAAETMQRLDEEERAQLGQTIAEAWGRERSQ